MKNILNLMDFPLKHSHEGSEMRKATKSHVKDVACNKMYKTPQTTRDYFAALSFVIHQNCFYYVIQAIFLCLHCK